MFEFTDPLISFGGVSMMGEKNTCTLGGGGGNGCGSGGGDGNVCTSGSDLL